MKWTQQYPATRLVMGWMIQYDGATYVPNLSRLLAVANECISDTTLQSIER